MNVSSYTDQPSQQQLQNLNDVEDKLQPIKQTLNDECEHSDQLILAYWGLIAFVSIFTIAMITVMVLTYFKLKRLENDENDIEDQSVTSYR